MLSAILPGFRHVRTPFATGVLYLVVIWVLFGNQVIESLTGTKFGLSITELSELFGSNVTTAALGFLAFLAGSLLSISGWTTLPVTDRDSILRPHGVPFPADWEKEFGSTARARWNYRLYNWRRSRSKVQKALKFALKMIKDVASRHSYYRSEIFELVRGPLGESTSFWQTIESWATRSLAPRLDAGLNLNSIEQAPTVPGMFKFGMRDAMGHRYMYPEMQDVRAAMSDEEAAEADAIDGQWLLIKSVAFHVRSEFQTLTLRLQIERPELYNDYDRLRSEAEFRFSVSPPLFLIVVLASLQWSPWVVVSAVIPMGLVVSGLRSLVRAEGLVWQALAANQIQSPLMMSVLEVPIQKSDGPGVRFSDFSP